MESILESAGVVLGFTWRLIVFVVVSVLFLPAFLVVTLLQTTWSKQLGELFGV